MPSGGGIHAIKRGIQTTRAMIEEYVSSPRSPLHSHVATTLNDTEFDVSSYISFPTEHRDKLNSIFSMELLNGEFKRRTHVV